MSIIDTQNAKTIRDPMVVSVKLDAREIVNTSASAVSPMPALFDANYLQETYPMRLIADLKVNGFPLDGSRVLLDTSVPETAENGKLGIRSWIGTNTGVSLTASRSVTNLTVGVTGCSMVGYNSGYYNVYSNTVVIPFNATSGTLMFYNDTTNDRVEIEYITPGVKLTYSNADLISCEVNLRSDLSPIDPSLPESEIEIRAYEPQDVTEIMSTVMENQPIIYRAGYTGDMAPTRKFYLSEPAQWADNCLTLKGVDAVHYLENDAPNTFIGWAYWDEMHKGTTWYDCSCPHRLLYLCAKDQLDKSNINITYQAIPGTDTSSQIPGRMVCSYIPEQSRRDILANMMNLLHHDYPSGYFNGIDSFWLNYVDAGIPTLTWEKPVSKWDIYEADCGDIKRNVDRKIVKIVAENEAVKVRGWDHSSLVADNKWTRQGKPRNNYQIGTLKVTEGESLQLTLDQATNTPYAVAYNGEGGCVYGYFYINGLANYEHELPAPTGSLNNVYGRAMFTGDQWQNWGSTYPGGMSGAGIIRVSRNIGLIGQNDTDIELQVYGGFLSFEDAEAEYTKDGVGITMYPSNTKWIGHIRAGKYGDSSSSMKLLPDRGFNSILARSNETGSFTWKGDPRMQPRDVFTFHKLDGTTELRTIETISLKHEGGGTVAEITYRKGVV